MSNTLALNQNYVNCGLGTMTYTVPTGGAGIYNAQVQLTEVPPSGVVILVKKNSSTVFTAPVLTPTQSAVQFKYSQPFADADVISVVISSSSAIDNQLNTVKSNVSIGQGA